MQSHFNGRPGRSYEFDASTDVVHRISWKTQVNTTGTMSIMEDSATNSPMKFSRTMALT